MPPIPLDETDLDPRGIGDAARLCERIDDVRRDESGRIVRKHKNAPREDARTGRLRQVRKATLHARHALTDFDLPRIGLGRERRAQERLVLRVAEVEPWIVEEVRLRHSHDARIRHDGRHRRENDVVVARRHFVGLAAGCDLLEAGLEAAHPGVAERRVFGDEVLCILVDDREFAAELRLEAPRNAVVAHNENDRPLTEIDARFVRGKIDLRLLVDRSLDDSFELALRHGLHDALSVKASVLLRIQGDRGRLHQHLAAPPHGIRHSLIANLKPHFVEPVRRDRAELRFRLRDERSRENHHHTCFFHFHFAFRLSFSAINGKGLLVS